MGELTYLHIYKTDETISRCFNTVASAATTATPGSPQVRGWDEDIVTPPPLVISHTISD